MPGWWWPRVGRPPCCGEAPAHPLAPARRKALLQRYARVAAGRLAALSDPEAHAELRAALRVE